MQLLPMASSPDGLISARYAVITKTPGWGVLTTTRNANVTQGQWGGGGVACRLWCVVLVCSWRRPLADLHHTWR